MSEAKLSYDYRQMLESEPPTKDENRVLIKEAYHGSEEEKWELVKRNARMVSWVLARRFSNKVCDESFSDGLWGFYTAVTRLREGATPQEFFGYCHKYIMGYVQQGVIQRASQLSKFRYINAREISMNQFDGSDEDTPRWEFDNPNEITPCEELTHKDAREYAGSFIETICEEKSMRLTDIQKERFKLLARHGGNLSSAAREAGVSAERMRVIKVLVEKRLFTVINSNEKLERDLRSTYGLTRNHEHDTPKMEALPTVRLHQYEACDDSPFEQKPFDSASELEHELALLEIA